MGFYFLKQNNHSFTHISEWTRLSFFNIYCQQIPYKDQNKLCLCKAFVSTACSVNPHGSDGSVTDTQIYIL